MAKRYRLPLFTTRIGLPTGSKEAASDGWFYPKDAAEETALQEAGCESDELNDPVRNDGTLRPDEVAQFRSVVSAAGNPTDLLTGTLQRVTITAALSTTATQAAAATGTYTKARVVWNNNGASGSAKLRIAVNTDNDVHGLMVGQSARRRDYEMTMGDGVMLVCGVPITRLTFSADGSVTGGTHQLQVAFGN